MPFLVFIFLIFLLYQCLQVPDFSACVQQQVKWIRSFKFKNTNIQHTHSRNVSHANTQVSKFYLDGFMYTNIYSGAKGRKFCTRFIAIKDLIFNAIIVQIPMYSNPIPKKFKHIFLQLQNTQYQMVHLVNRTNTSHFHTQWIIRKLI